MTIQIYFPSVPGMPIVAHEQKSRDHKAHIKTVTLKEAKEAVFGAVLRGDLVLGESVDKSGIEIIRVTIMSAAEAEKSAKEYGFRVETVHLETDPASD